MKVIGVSLAALAVWCSAAPVHAQQQGQDTSAVESQKAIESVTVTARRYKVVPREFASYEYAYNLSNGDVVRFSHRVGRYYVSVKGQPTVEIYSTDLDRFVTKDGAKLLFTEGGEALTIDNYEKLLVASGLPVAALQAPK